ncbi:hypothetical protein [Streptomyces sp. AK02-04a]|uniref:hypothetical protein n=1 Tax=Streptomyces sp. AK02-04a TaxID=3028649 RepID=UPI0029B12778|nr:hypothetical protein [Streptomyces sp. AK02-04a]MDX3763643.1 hypothetical protein [Streptomyces sp. AK02-04a]
MSVLALRLGRLSLANQLAETAVETAGPGATPSVASYLLIQRAVTRARAYERNAALTDLITAENKHHTDAEPTISFSHYPSAALHFQRAEVFLALGMHTEAISALRRSARLRESATQHRSFAITQARLAEALMRTGQLEPACHHWGRFLDHHAHVRSALARQALHALHQQLRPYQRHPAAADILERARSAMSLPS